MLNKLWKRIGESLALAAAVLATGAWVRAQEAKTPEAEKRFTIRLTDEEPKTGVRYRLALPKGVEETEVRTVKGGEYWIGVQLGTLDELTLSHLKLKQGVVAEQVFPDSPAAKALVQKHDVLLKFGDYTIATPDDLIAAVEKSKDTPVELTVIREGKEVVLKVTAAKRPQEKVLSVEISPKGEEVRRIEAWIEKLHKGQAGSDPVEMHIFRPGVMLHGLYKAAEYPKDLSISITKQGNEPAKISVKRGDKSWEVTADKMNELPSDVRPFVEQLFVQHGTAPMHAWLTEHAKKGLLGGPKATQVAPVPSVPAVPRVAPPLPLPRVIVRDTSDGSDKQALEAVQRELEALLKKVEDLKAARTENPVDKMKREIDALRKELDELRKAAGKSDK